MRKLIYLSTLLLLFVLPVMAQHPLFPTPAKVQNGKGSFVIGKNLQVQGNGGYADKLAAGLQTELKEAGLQSSPASGTIRLELTNDCKMADEAYTLVVEPNSILLQASSEADHRRGCRQLARPESTRYVLHPGRDQGDRCLCS